MKNLFLIGTGGFIGTIFRYLLSGLPYKYLNTHFPVGTLLVNFIGTCVIGYFMEFSVTRSYISDTVRMFITIGILGGFTTYSSFSYETVSLLKSGHYSYALLNILLTNILCLGGTFIGTKI